MKDFFRSINANLLISALLSIILGVTLVVFPGVSLEILCKAVGIIVIITGLGFLVSHFCGGIFASILKLDIILGIIFCILGIFILTKPAGLASIIPVVFGIMLIYHGMVDMQQAFGLHKYEYARWWIVFIISLITIVLGIVVIMNPFNTAKTLMMAIGIILIYDGIMNLLIVGRVSGSMRHFEKKTETIEGEYREVEEDDGE